MHDGAIVVRPHSRGVVGALTLEIVALPGNHVIEENFHVLIPVRPALLVPKPRGVEKLVYERALTTLRIHIDGLAAAGLLHSYLG